MHTAAINVVDVCKSFERGKPVLQGINLSIAKGEMVALIGASGSGKSTLIRAIAGLMPIDRRSSGSAKGGQPCCIELFGSPMQKGGQIGGEAKALRARVGVVFQQFKLVPRLSVMTNVLLGLLGQIGFVRGTFGRFTRAERARAMRALERVGIAEQALKRGSALSGGQQQRAAIARTLIQGSEILIADEPIASLDPNSARRIMDILAELNIKDGITVLVSLHQVEYALKYCPRFGNKSAMEAVDRSGGEIFAQTVDSEGNPGYWSLILVNKDSPYEKLQDILKCDHTLNFGIGDPNSTSGFLVPTTYIFAANNIDPKLAALKKKNDDVAKLT